MLVGKLMAHNDGAWAQELPEFEAASVSRDTREYGRAGVPVFNPWAALAV